ncbi:hypothetical protein ACK9YZ_30865 [Rhizobium sp. ZK1]|uniref:hypothetical protein n=1 Tax=Rhizobium sp. ZK1 TaxID=3389872 RepID=UPI0039F6B2A8
MAADEHAPHWVSDVVQTELREPQKFCGRTCILLFPPIDNWLPRPSVTRRIAKKLLSKVRAILASNTPSMSPAECEKAAEAYLHACTAVPLFCYVSPALYGLASKVGEQALEHGGSQAGDER